MRNHHRPGTLVRFVALVLIAAACPSLAIASEFDECECEESSEDFDYLEYGCCPYCIDDESEFGVCGWLAQGYTWNPANPIDRFNGPVAVNDRANEYQLNQFYVSAGRGTSADGPHFGYRADVLYGTDVYMFQSLGLDDHIVSDSASRFYKLAIPELYAAAFLPIGPGLRVKIGKWNALVGYETGLGRNDFFYSKTFGYNVTAATNTGVLVETELGDHWITSHGINRGMDTWEDNNNALSYTGHLEWFNCDETASAFFALYAGPEQDERADWQDLDGAPGPDAPGESLERVVWSLTLERQWTEKFRTAVNFDYLFQEGSVAYDFENAEAYGMAVYLHYRLTDRIETGLRTEIYRDDDAFTSAGIRSESPAAAALYTNVTLACNFALRKNLLLRPEIRWDWQDRDDLSDPPAYDSGTSAKQFLAAFDIVATF